MKHRRSESGWIKRTVRRVRTGESRRRVSPSQRLSGGSTSSTMMGSVDEKGPRHYLWVLRPCYSQLRGLLIIGSICGAVMNIAVVLPALLLGHAINVVAALGHGRTTASQVGAAGLLLIAGNAATEVPRIGKRYWLGVARARFATSMQADGLRGALFQEWEGSAEMAVGDVMARIVGDVDVLSMGVGEVMVETWETLFFQSLWLERATRIELAFSAWEAEDQSSSVALKFLVNGDF